jgi:hypothetical protein
MIYFLIRNAIRASLPPIVNIVDLAKFRPHDLPTLQPLTTLPKTCLELDHELAYSYIAEVETSSLTFFLFLVIRLGKVQMTVLKLNATSSYLMFATLVQKTET